MVMRIAVGRVALLSLLCCIAMPRVARGQESHTPATRPAKPMLDRPRDGGRTPREFFRERMGTFDPGNNGPLTEQERSDVAAFMKTYSPKRWDRWQDVPDTRKDRIERLIHSQYRMLQRIKAEDPEVYDIRLKRLPIEDEMFALAWELKHDDPKDTTNPAELRSKLRAEVGRFVQNSLEERRLRIARIQRRLSQDQQELEKARIQLQAMMDERDALVEKGLADLENERGQSILKDLAAPILTQRRPQRDNATTEPAAGEPAAGEPSKEQSAPDAQ